MTVNEAISLLKQAKKDGVKNVVLAWWEADMFDRKDDEDWAHDAEIAERKMDWSGTRDDIAMCIDLYGVANG